MATKLVEIKTKNHTYTVPAKFSNLGSVSAVIRAMAKDGKTRAQISNSTGIRYQHVRNVLITPLTS